MRLTFTDNNSWGIPSVEAQDLLLKSRPPRHGSDSTLRRVSQRSPVTCSVRRPEYHPPLILNICTLRVLFLKVQVIILIDIVIDAASDLSLLPVTTPVTVCHL